MASEALAIGATGINFNSGNGASSAAQAIPNMADGTKPKYIRVSTNGPAYFAFGQSGVAAATTDALIQAGDSQVFLSNGATHCAAWGIGAAQIVQVSPLEWMR